MTGEINVKKICCYEQSGLTKMARHLVTCYRLLNGDMNLVLQKCRGKQYCISGPYWLVIVYL